MPAPRTTEPPLPHAHRPQSPHPLRLSRPLARKTRHQRDDSADLSALFSQDIPKQKSAADIHTHLWNLSLALQQGRISPRRAAVLAYINSLLLRTLPAISKQEDSTPQKIIIDIPGAIRHFPEDDEINASFRSGESSDSHSSSPSPSLPRGKWGESLDSHPGSVVTAASAAESPHNNSSAPV